MMESQTDKILENCTEMGSMSRLALGRMVGRDPKPLTPKGLRLRGETGEGN